MPLRVGLFAGEASGDTLGADLIEALRRLVPEAQFFGVAGPKMQAAGCVSWEPAESFALMGLFEVLAHLPRLLRLLSRITRMFLSERPDVFVGIDAQEASAYIAKRLHAAGIPTVQYVSPQVWAWRQGRARSIGARMDLILCLLPFEKRVYDEHGVRAEFVGHPLADAIPLKVDRAAARAELGLPQDASVVALLPGSRRGEVTRLAADIAATARSMQAKRLGLVFIAALANRATREIFAATLASAAPEVEVRMFEAQAQKVLIAADVVLTASGTATLETALCKRPMVVIYRAGAFTAWIVRHTNLIKAKYFSQPNLLADRRLVGEYFQDDIVPESIGAELLMWLDNAERRSELQQSFEQIHAELRRDAGSRAALAIMSLLAQRRGTAAAS
jgi:lipid-A-disaccharide synthase